MLSPLDWAMVEAWKERGIPVRIAIRAIETVFDRVDKQPNKARSIKSLSYCRDEVEAQYEEWLSAQVGKTSADETEDSPESDETGALNEETIQAHIAKLRVSLRDAKVGKNLRPVLTEVSGKLEELGKVIKDSESVEKDLAALESLIDEALLKDRNESDFAAIKSKVKKQLTEYEGKMEQDVYEKTFELMLLKNLREETGIPRLSLFYL